MASYLCVLSYEPIMEPQDDAERGQGGSPGDAQEEPKGDQEKAAVLLPAGQNPEFPDKILPPDKIRNFRTKSGMTVKPLG